MAFGVILKRAVRDFRQHFLTHLMTTIVVGLTCLIFVFFSLFSFNLQQVVERFGRQLAVIVYLKKDVSQERIPSIYQKIAGLEGIESVKFVSSEEAFKRLEKFFKDEEEVLQGVDPLFLPPCFEVQINRAVYNLGRIKDIAARLSRWPEVDRVQYGRAWVDRLEAFSSMVRVAVVASGLILLITAAFVVSNTIKLTVFARQEEIEIMRLVGGTSGFIQGPFLLAAFLQGTIGAGAAILVSFFAYRYTLGMLDYTGLVRSLSLQFLPPAYIALFVPASGLFCVLGTAVALRRFLKL